MTFLNKLWLYENNFKEVKRNVIAKVKNEEKEKHEKDNEAMLQFFKDETQGILEKFNLQRHELTRRTLNFDNLGKFIIQQEMFITVIAKLLAENIKMKKVERVDDGKHEEIGKISYLKIDKLLLMGGAIVRHNAKRLTSQNIFNLNIIFKITTFISIILFINFYTIKLYLLI